MFRELSDPLRQQRNLNFRRTGVLLVTAKRRHHIRLVRRGHRHYCCLVFRLNSPLRQSPNRPGCSVIALASVAVIN
jgi:hypothetical protein